MGQFSFVSSEKLKSRKRIEQLFVEGHSFKAFPFRVVWLPAEKTQVAFSVPKRAFRKAVDRNQIKRKIREAYRLQKHDLYDQLAFPVSFLIIYTQRTALPYSEMERGMQKLIRRFPENIRSTTNQ